MSNTETINEMQEEKQQAIAIRPSTKILWQQRHRKEFKELHGYSTTADYGCGGLREAVLERDDRACVQCSMTDEEHKAKWSRPITVDHKDRDRSHNTMENLQTLCLTCHGKKDQLPILRERKLDNFKYMILDIRQNFGTPYEVIAKHFHVSIATVWKSIQRWEREAV